MTNLTEAEIMAKYALTDEQIKNITQTVISALSYDKEPSDRPLTIVVGGQSGSGKTALINYTSQISSQRSFVQIDNDFFRGFHPQSEEIKALYPGFYTAATDQIGLGITSDVIQYFMDNKYDIILHQTLKNNRIADDAITKFREAGYTVGVRAFAVPYMESKMSQIERCEGQIEKLGFCRYVRKSDHDAAVEGLPKTVGYIEESGKYDFIEVFRRSENISKPELVYAKINPETREETLKTLSNCEQASHKDRLFGFSGAQDAVERTRLQEALRIEKTIDDRILEAEQSPANNPEMQGHIDELKANVLLFRIEHGIIDQSQLSAQTTSTTPPPPPLP